MAESQAISRFTQHHRTFKKTLIARTLLASLLLLQCAAPTCLSIVSSAHAASSPTSLTAAARQEIVSFNLDSKQVPLGKLVPFDASLISNRTPLILIHGIGAENDKLYHWNHFVEHASKSSMFMKRFKVYLFRYETSQSVPELSNSLQQVLNQFISENGNRQFRILAYSEGGLLTRNALQDPAIFSHVEKVITVGTPFHGSPLASTPWLKKQLKETSPLSPVRMTNRISYWVARKKFPSFETDFHWDNFDQAVPETEYTGRGPIQGFSTENSDKFITYGSFFGVGIDPDQRLARALGLQEPLPKEKPRFRNPFSSHFLFSLVRNNISKMPIAGFQWIKGDKRGIIAKKETQANIVSLPDTEESGYNALMLYNDGISPISSTLWIGRFMPSLHHKEKEAKESKSHPVAAMWSTLKSLRGSKVARLFPGLDHRDWLDGSTRIDTREVRDLLHPEEPSKTVFDWFMYDLMS